MCDRQAEEPREATRLHPRISGFQRPPERLGAHVDAEDRLNVRRRCASPASRGGELFGQRPLLGLIGSLLQGQIDA